MIQAYGTFMVLAWIAVLALGTLVAWRRGSSWWRVLSTLAIALVAAVIGARLFDLVVNWSFYSEDFSRIYSPGFHGFALYGGLIFAAAAAYGASRALGLSSWHLADSAVPAVTLGIVLMRTGCFLNGCCFGKPTSLPWGVTYPAGSAAWAEQLASGKSGVLGFAGAVQPVHPTQFYEAAAAVFFCLLALGVLTRRQRGPRLRLPPGVVFMIFALGFTLFRLANDFLRAQSPGNAMLLWFNPAIHMVVAAGIAGALFWRLGATDTEEIRVQTCRRPL